MLSLDNKLFDTLLLDAENGQRKRSHYNIHKDYNEPVQRLCIALKSGTYIRPHYHSGVNAWEMILVLRGEAVMLIFDEDGYVKKRCELSSSSGKSGIELLPNTWHMVFPKTSEVILFEVKQGPFTEKKSSDFASWSPEEDSSGVEDFLAWAKCAVPGDKYLSL